MQPRAGPEGVRVVPRNAGDFLSPTGTSKSSIFQDLPEACFQLYQRRFLQVS